MPRPWQLRFTSMPPLPHLRGCAAGWRACSALLVAKLHSLLNGSVHALLTYCCRRMALSGCLWAAGRVM